VISDGTVKTHVTHVLSKFGVRDRVHPVILAYESGVITPGQAT
jgi:DNA-binding NarL/FixJ family response regulator